MRKSRKLAVVAGIVASMLIAGVALASWLAGGTGTGYAKAGSAVDLSTVASTASGTALYPGGSGDVVLTVHNPNPYDVDVTSIAGNGAITSDAGSACDASTGVSFTDQTGTWTVPAGGDLDITLADAASMDNSSDDSCQGATFDIPVSLSGASA